MFVLFKNNSEPVNQCITVNKLQKIQNKAARIVTRTPRLHHITPVLKQLHWLPVECRIQFKMIVMVLKCLHSEAHRIFLICYNPVKWTVAFALTMEIALSPCSDSAIKLYQPIARKSVGERAFSVTAPKLWNTLPTDLRILNVVSVFKRRLKTHFFSNYFN